ncbi:MBOAT family protein, partial [Klebsiella pneumoniae]|nr:MBOAT family protein [Klebsiella pneumoniae]
RWHITLGNFLRDYLYIPLGGNRKAEARTLLNLFLTFLLGGIWHGAGWTFIIWGMLHGGAMVVWKTWRRARISMPNPLAWLLTFAFVNV